MGTDELLESLLDWSEAGLPAERSHLPLAPSQQSSGRC